MRFPAAAALLCILLASATFPAGANQETPDQEAPPQETPDQEAPPQETPGQETPGQEPPTADPEKVGPATLAPPIEAAPVQGIEVDGVVGEEEWAGAATVGVPWEWFPSDNAPAPVDTEVLIAFDEANLYVAFRAHDPEPGAIRAHLSDRDAQLRDDVVGFEIDTFDDRRRAYRFQSNPLGVQLDAQVSDVDHSVDLSWNAIWDSAGRITAGGYEVEMAIPFRQLRFPRTGAGTQTWGFLAYRDHPRSVLHELKSARNDRDLDCRVCKFERLGGLAALETGRNVELYPTVTGGRTDRRTDLAGPLEGGSEDLDAGLTARWGITNNLALHAAVNPDFSQVEADAAQLDVNERFALFFPEKRPFFLEGADYFATPFRAVFTRTVADPELGVRLTGKDGPHAFGVFVARDRINNLLLPGVETSSIAFLDEEVSSGVARYRRDVGSTSTLGFLYAGRDGGGGYENHVYGLDGSLRLGASDTVRFQVLESRSRYPRGLALGSAQPTGSFDGLAYRADYTRNTRDWVFRLFHGSLDETFRADSGFIPRVGYQESFAVVQRNLWGPPDGWYSRVSLVGSVVRLEDQEGELIEQGGNLELLYQGPLQSQVRLGIRPNREAFRGETFDNLRGDLSIEVRPSGDLTLDLFLRGGEIIDFVNVRQADFTVVRPRVAFKLGRHVTGDLQHERQEFEVDGDRFLAAGLTQSSLIYHFNVRTFLRAIVQYRDVERDLALYAPGVTLRSEDQDLFTQVLFSYKLDPQTVFQAGYSDLYVGPGAIDLTQQSRSFFLKIGYALLW